MRTNLTGMFFVEFSDDGASPGEIGAEVAPSVYLVRYDSNDASKLPFELATIDEMTSFGEDGLRPWRFFESREELHGWWKRFDEPSANRVVTLVRPVRPIE